jgi:hypothetical protein
MYYVYILLRNIINVSQKINQRRRYHLKNYPENFIFREEIGEW